MSVSTECCTDHRRARTSTSSMDVSPVVTEAAQAVAREAGIKTPRIHAESGSNDGDGFTSVIYRLVVTDEDGPGELRLICKTTATDANENSLMEFLYAAEDCIYNTVVPLMESVAKLQEPLPWPKCHYSSVSSARPCLLVADKCPEGFRMADKRLPLDEAHLRLALRQLGRYHGAGMALLQLRPDEFRAAARTVTEPYQREQMRAMMRSTRLGESAPDHLLERFPAGSEAHGKLKTFFSTFLDKYVDEMVTPGEGVGNSLIHGDCHVNNMLFQYDEAGAVQGCCLIDFQTTRLANTAQDVATLMLCCTDKALRDQHWEALLRHYHDALQATLRDAGIADPDAVYSWDMFMRRLRDASCCALMSAPMLLGALCADPAELKELQDSFASVLSDSAAEGAMAGIGIRWSPNVTRRVADLADDLLRWGWL